MNRITPEMVKEAYAKTGLEPSRNNIAGRFSCCALGALYRASGTKIQDPYEWAYENFGEDYGRGFWAGFDGVTKMAWDHAQGFADGRAAAAAVFGESP